MSSINSKIGIIFQAFELINSFTAIENVMLPLDIAKKPSYQIAKDLLGDLGLADRLEHLPKMLSGGEQQRVSVARAITHNPKILFADEPTANLDSVSADTVMSIFKKLHKENGLTIVMVTHENDYGHMADRIITLSDGMVVS